MYLSMLLPKAVNLLLPVTCLCMPIGHLSVSYLASTTSLVHLDDFLRKLSEASLNFKTDATEEDQRISVQLKSALFDVCTV